MSAAATCPGALLALFLGGHLTQAFAQDSGRVVRLSYSKEEGVEGCPDEDVVRRVVAGHLGRNPFDANAPQVLHARVEQTAAGLRARVLLTEDGRLLGQSDVTSAARDCKELGFSMMLALSIAIDPLVALRASPMAEMRPAAEEMETTARSAPTAGARTRWTVGVGGQVSTGLAPSTSGGVALRAAVRRARTSLGLDVRWDPPVSRSIEEGDLGTSVLLAAAVPCWHLSRFAGCGVLGLGAFHVTGNDLGESTNDGYKPLATVGPRLAASLPIGSVLSLQAHAEVLVAPLRTTVEVNDEAVWTLPRFSAGGGITVAARLP